MDYNKIDTITNWLTRFDPQILTLKSVFMLTINVVKIYTFLNNKILKQNGMTQQRLKKKP